MNPRCVENEMAQMEYTGANMQADMGMMNMSQGCMTQPVYECPQERICERFIMHEVPQE